MNFEPGDIVTFVHHPLLYIIGRSAEILSVHPEGWKVHPILEHHGKQHTWYVVHDCKGEKRCAYHPWLRKVPPLWTPSHAEMEVSA